MVDAKRKAVELKLGRAEPTFVPEMCLRHTYNAGPRTYIRPCPENPGIRYGSQPLTNFSLFNMAERQVYD